MDKISVIIPVYKVEKYLNECLESVVNQTYTNLEIILVDDGSPDNCPKMCEEWASKDNRIRVIHKQNGGLSDARNAGLDIMTGKYFTFIDSDDLVGLTYIEVLKQNLDKTGADLSMVSYLQFENQVNAIYEEQEIEVLSKDEAMYKLVYFYKGFMPAWGKLYLTEKYGDHRFLFGKINEDEFYANEIYYRTNKVCCSNKQLYYYRTNPDSIIHREFNPKQLSQVECLEYRDDFLVKKGFTNLLYMNRLWLLTKIMATHCKARKLKYNKEAKQLFKKFKYWYKKINKKDFSLKYRLRFWLFKISRGRIKV